jgi:hypothetical protein
MNILPYTQWKVETKTPINRLVEEFENNIEPYKLARFDTYNRKPFQGSVDSQNFCINRTFPKESMLSVLFYSQWFMSDFTPMPIFHGQFMNAGDVTEINIRIMPSVLFILFLLVFFLIIFLSSGLVAIPVIAILYFIANKFFWNEVPISKEKFAALINHINLSNSEQTA